MSAAPGAKLGDAWIGVTVDASKVGPELEAKVDTALEGVAATADAAMGQVAESAQAAAAKVTEAFEAATRAQQDGYLRATAAAENASARAIAAANAQKTALGEVAAAEKALADARTGGDTEKVAAAEASLLTARGKAEVGAQKVVAAAAVEQKAKADLAAATEALAGKEEASAARIGAAAEGIKTKWAGMTSLVGGVAVAVMVKGAADYQTQLTKLATTAGAGLDQVDALGRGMLDMAGQVGESAQELAKGMYTVESSLPGTETGAQRTADALTILKASAQGAKQEGADLGKVADAVSTALHDYHLPASMAATVTSQMITAVSHGKTTFDELTGSLHSVTPLASALHVSLADVTGVLTGMTASGESADQATQNMADTLRHLANPTNVMTQELASLGISSSDLNDMLGTKGLSGTLQTVEGAIVNHLDPATQRVLLPALNQSKSAAADMHEMISKMPPGIAKLSQGLLDGSTDIAGYTKAAKGLGGQAGPMATQFLSLYKSQDGFNAVLKAGGPAAQSFEAAMAKSFGTASAMNVALQTTGENADAVNAAIKDIAGAAPEADGSIRGWSEVQGNFNQQLAETKAAIESWAIRIGQDLLPAATKVLGVLKGLVDWLGKHKTAAEVLIGVIGGIAVAWAAIKIGQGIKAIADDFVGAGKAAKDAALKLWGFFTVEQEGTGVTKAAALASKAWAAAQWLVNAAMSPLGLTIGAIVIAVGLLAFGVYELIKHWSAVSHLAQEVGHWFAWLGGVIWGALKTAFDWVKGHWVLILEIIAGPVGWVVALFTNFGPQILRALAGAGKAVLGWVEGVGHWLASLPGKAWAALVTFGPKVLSAIVSGLEAAAAFIVSWIVKVVMFYVTLPIKIAVALYVLGKVIWEAFLSAFQYLVANVPIWLDKARQFFVELPGKIWGALVSLQATLHDAFWTAVEAVKAFLVTAIANIITFFVELPGKIASGLATLGSAIGNAFTAAATWAWTVVTTSVANIITFFEQAPGKIGSALSSLGSTIGNAISSALEWAKQLAITGVANIVTFISQLPSKVTALGADMLSAGTALIHNLISGLADAAGFVGDIGKKVVNSIIGFVNSNIVDNINGALNFSVMGVDVHAGNIPHIPLLAQGGVIDRPTLAIVGEDGPEAVVPLTKPGRAADVMSAAGLTGGGGGGGVHLHVNQQLTVPKSATAAQAAALFEQNLSTGLRLGARGGLSAGLAALGAVS